MFAAWWAVQTGRGLYYALFRRSRAEPARIAAPAGEENFA